MKINSEEEIEDWPGLGVEGVGIGLVNKVACTGGHAIFINIVFLHAGNEQFPHGIAIHLVHGMAAGLPAVEVAHNTDGYGVRCPPAPPADQPTTGTGTHPAGTIAASADQRPEQQRTPRRLPWPFSFAHLPAAGSAACPLHRIACRIGADQ